MGVDLWPKLSNPKVSGKNISGFAGGRLTFQKQGSASAGFSGCVWSIFGVLTCIMEFNACHDKSIRNFLICVVCLLTM